MCLLSHLLNNIAGSGGECDDCSPQRSTIGVVLLRNIRVIRVRGSHLFHARNIGAAMVDEGDAVQVLGACR
jgi:hypothetical protein